MREDGKGEVDDVERAEVGEGEGGRER